MTMEDELAKFEKNLSLLQESIKTMHEEEKRLIEATERFWETHDILIVEKKDISNEN